MITEAESSDANKSKNVVIDNVRPLEMISTTFDAGQRSDGSLSRLGEFPLFE